MNKAFTIPLNRPMAYAQGAVAVVIGIAAAVYATQGEPMIVLVFGIVATTNAILAVGGLRSYVTAEGTTLTAQNFYRHQVVELKGLATAQAAPSRGGIVIVLKNTSGQVVRFILPTNNKAGMQRLIDYLKPYLMASGVNRDKKIDQVIEKYASPA